MKSKIIWAGHVVRREVGEVRREFWCGDLIKGDHLEDLGVDGSIIFKSTFKKWTGLNWLSGQGQLASSCECGSELSG